MLYGPPIIKRALLVEPGQKSWIGQNFPSTTIVRHPESCVSSAMESARYEGANYPASKRARTNRAESGEQSGVDCRYKKFDDQKAWEVFKLPVSKLTVEDVRGRASFSPNKKLTHVEVAERQNWIMNRKEWKASEPIRIQTAKQFLDHRILAPILTASAHIVSGPSTSREQRDRTFPSHDAVLEWKEFDELVSLFEPCEVSNPEFQDTWYLSGSSASSLRDEEGEKHWLNSNVLDRLHEAKLLDNNPITATPEGRPDLYLCGRCEELQSIVVCIETKSTHNLWIPSTTESIVVNYKEAWNHSPDLNHSILHPIGQVVRTMIVHKVMHGVLSSATRTYFLRFETKTDGVRLLVSRRWYVGEHNYLRAWAWFSSSAGREDKANFPEHQLKSWTKQSPRQVPKRSSPRLGKDVCNLTLANIAHIEWNDIDYSGVILGYGRHGSVREAVWGNKSIAVKVFDVDHEGVDSFERELSAYLSLNKVQGLLIPKLYFWSRHWAGSLFAIGLQAGRWEPVHGSRDSWAEKEAVLEGLREYGFLHHDSDDIRNFIYIDDEEGGERLVAIDLESIEPYRSSPSSIQLYEEDRAESDRRSIYRSPTFDTD